MEPIPVKKDVEVTITFMEEEPIREEMVRFKSEKNLLEEWSTKGLVKLPSKGIKKSIHDEHPPVFLPGKPLSQIIIEDRGIN